jgi:hypothetical protein
VDALWMLIILGCRLPAFGGLLRDPIGSTVCWEINRAVMRLCVKRKIEKERREERERKRQRDREREERERERERESKKERERAERERAREREGQKGSRATREFLIHLLTPDRPLCGIYW